jgi:DNA-binding MarR family transcriptional regulator
MKLLKFSYEDVSRVLTYTEMEILRALEIRPEVERIIYEQAEIRNIDPKKVLHY